MTRQDNIFETICVPGYTKTVRPPYTVTARVYDSQKGHIVVQIYHAHAGF
jgi:hypothetical protein